jgi:ABC-type phosphate transport system substrate-binding protein
MDRFGVPYRSTPFLFIDILDDQPRARVYWKPRGLPMRLTNGILAVALALGALVLSVPSPAGAKTTPTGDKSGCMAPQTSVTMGNCSKAKSLKKLPVPVEATGSATRTTRAAHPRR